MIEREIDRGLRFADRDGADDGALVLEVPHDGMEAAAFLAEPVLGGNAAAVETSSAVSEERQPCLSSARLT